MTTTNSNMTDADIELLGQAAQGYTQLREQIGRVVIGQDPVVRQLLASIFANGHVLIIGVPGLAKTLLVKTLAGVLGWSFKRIQFTPDMMPADIIGMEMLHNTDAPAGHSQGEQGWAFMKGPIFANLVLADEINRTPPKTQAALLEAMQEYTVTSMGHGHELEKPFIVMATQNPIEQEGTYPLPEAQLDRFMFSLWVDYPARDEEEAMVSATTQPRDESVEQIFTKEQLLDFQNLVLRMPASQHVVSYAVSLARATRPDDALADDYVRRYVRWGAGPRAGQFLVLAAKAYAVLDGRPTVSAQDIREAAQGVLSHRVLPNYHAAGEGISAKQIIEHVVKNTPESDYQN